MSRIFRLNALEQRQSQMRFYHLLPKGLGSHRRLLRHHHKRFCSRFRLLPCSCHRFLWDNRCQCDPIRSGACSSPSSGFPILALGDRRS